jgi:hypothetical protein
LQQDRSAKVVITTGLAVEAPSNRRLAVAFAELALAL